MTEDGGPFEGGSSLRRMLRELGQAPTQPPRGIDAERAREDRMAAHIDAELSQLVRERRRQRWAIGSALSAAAMLALVWGLHRGEVTPGGVPIAQEPVLPHGVAPSAPAAEPEEPPANPQPTAAPLASRPATAPPPPSSSAPAPSATSSAVLVPLQNESTLGEENRLFKAAAESSRSGDVRRSIELLDRLLTEYPRSPLAQTALVRKFRLLSDSGRADEAAREAQRYLSLYPTGFAVSEAQALEPHGAAPSNAEPSNP